MKHFALIFTLLSTASSAYADNEKQSFELSPVTVTGNRIEQIDTRTPYAAEIYTHATIEKSGATTLIDFLTRFSSLTVMPSYGSPYSALFDMRGYGIQDGHQNIAITINGRRLNNIDSSPAFLSSISLASIERIEIIKGSGSVAQGDNAMAGMINIVTRDITGTSFNINAGSHGQKSANINAGYAQQYFSIQLLADNSKLDGYREREPILGLKDNSELTNLSLGLKLFPTNNLELRLGKEKSEMDTVYSGHLTLSEFEKNPNQSDHEGWSTQKFDTNINRFGTTINFDDRLHLNADYVAEEKSSIATYIAYSSTYPYEYDHKNTDISLSYVSGSWNITMGYQLFHGLLDDGSSETEKENSGTYLNTTYSTSDVVISAGIRHELVEYTHTSTGSQSNDVHSLNAWDLGINYQISNTISIFTNINQAFQAPDVNRFFVTDYNVTPPITSFNAFIQPAKSRNFNIGLNHENNINKLKLVVFYSDIKNEIYYYDAGNWTGRNTNIDKSHKYGFELNNKTRLTSRLGSNLNYSWVKAIIDKENENNGDYNGNKLPGISEHSLMLSLDYQILNNGNLSIVQNWRSEAYAYNDFENNQTQKQKALLTTDIGYNHTLGQFTVYAQVNNLFDRTHGLWIKDNAIYPVNFERTWIAGLRASF